MDKMELTLKDFLKYMTSEEIKTAIYDATVALFTKSTQDIVKHVNQIIICIAELKRRELIA